MKLIRRIEAALAYALPGAIVDLRALLILFAPRADPPEDADRWDTLTWARRLAARTRRECIATTCIWLAFFKVHGSYLYTLLYAAFGGRKGGQWFRSKLVQEELRKRTVRSTWAVCG